MANIYVSFDTRSGQILSVHNTTVEPQAAMGNSPYRRKHGVAVGDEHVGVLQVPFDSLDSEALYKVDIERRRLVAATTKDGGVGFSFGEGG